MTGMVPLRLPLETRLVRCWENLVGKTGLVAGLFNPGGKHINVGWWLSGDSEGGPVPRLVPCLDGNADRRTEIKRISNTRVPQGLDIGMVGDVHSRQGRNYCLADVMVAFVASDHTGPLCEGGSDLSAVHIVGSNVLLLVQNGDGRGRGIRGHVGQHDNLNIVIQEEPRLLESDAHSERIRVSHNRGSDFTIRYAPNESLDANSRSEAAAQGRSTVIGGNARDKVPIPGCGDVLVLVSSEIRIQCSIREVEAENLQGM